VKLMATPITQSSSLSTKLSAVGGSAARASSQPKSPVISTTNIRNFQADEQASPSNETLGQTSDPPSGLRAQDQIVPLSMGELSPILGNNSTAK
jgi:hypothetical protein